MDRKMIPLRAEAVHGTIDWRAWALAVVFAIASFAINAQGNHFPSTYHPDEPSKARQVINGEFNFHHPMLLLTTTRLIVAVTGTPMEQDPVTFAGRTASAIFTAIAVACLVLLASLLAGPLAGGISGLFLVTNHQLLELAHYFKEDPAVLMGISAFFLALCIYDRAPGIGRAVLLGGTVGLAVSGKYVGGVVLPIGVALILVRGRGKTGELIALLLAAIATFALVNAPLFFNPAGFAAGFEREVGFAVSGHKGITRSVPHGVYGAVFREATNFMVWILLGIYAIGLILRRRTAPLSEWMTALFPLAFAIMLSFSPKTHHRYFLPATGLILTIAAIGAVTPAILRWKNRGLQVPAWTTATILALVTTGVQAPRFLEYFNGFREDTRTTMAKFVREYVPSGAVIVQDKRFDLDALGLPYEFRGKLFAADEGTLDELRAQGVEYFGVAEGDFGRFFREKFKPTEDGAEDFYRRKAFYEQLFDEGELLFECKGGTLLYLQPEIRLYHLPPPGE